MRTPVFSAEALRSFFYEHIIGTMKQLKDALGASVDIDLSCRSPCPACRASMRAGSQFPVNRCQMKSRLKVQGTRHTEKGFRN